jgi:uncharacterized protein (TIGR02646 family)
MIRIDRKKVAPPPELQSRGEAERAEAIAFFGKKKNRTQPFSFKAYKHPAVVEALASLFHSKCAYCESVYAATQPVDVEHYRPKGAVVGERGRPEKPGYYWLAAEWENLLPSCIDCNRQREHGRGRLSGKANLFPLEDPRERARRPGDEAKERPLLLNPCADDPAQHLEFLEGGLVRAALAGKRESAKGQSSIEVYGLRRPGLVRARKALELKIRARLKHVAELAAALDAGQGDRAQLEEWIREAIEELKGYTRPQEPYAAMARALIERFFGSL